jgi:hypothetical protein
LPSVTHSDPIAVTSPPVRPPCHITARLGNTHAVRYQAVRSLDPVKCDFHPNRNESDSEALIDYIDDRGRFRRRGCCGDCLVVVLPWIEDADTADVMVWFARPADMPDVLPEITPEPESAQVLRLGRAA